MENEITFRTEIEFKGSIEEFQRVADALVKLPIRIRVEWPPGHTAGCWPIAIDRIFSKQMLNKFTEGMPSLKIVKGIDGGMRDPHLHVGDQIVLLTREKFKEIVGKAAMEITEKIADKAEYTQAVGAIRKLVEHSECEAIPIHLP